MVWLDRALIQMPRVGLCVTEQEFLQACAELGVQQAYLPDGGDSCAYRLFPKSGGQVYLVVIDELKDWQPFEVYSCLVHEAVHVFQFFCEMIGETRPSAEFEAYSIQHIATELMDKWNRRTL